MGEDPCSPHQRARLGVHTQRVLSAARSRTRSARALRVAPTAERSFGALPQAAAAAVVEFITGPLTVTPHGVGKGLQRELAGLMVARRGPYRVIYEVLEDEHAVCVLRIDHRADVYRR